MLNSRFTAPRCFITSIILLITAFASANLFAEDKVEWQAVEGANHYVVEIRKDNELVLETRTTDNWIPLFLPAGSYEFQVRVISSFGKEASSSEWSPLTLLAPSVPFVISLYPHETHEDTENNYTVKVSGFLEDSETKDGSVLVLESEDEKPIALEIVNFSQQEGWTELTLNTGRQKPELGTWTLTMINPDGQVSSMPNALEVLPDLKPRIRSVTPKKIDAGPSHSLLSLEITGMEEGAEVLFHGTLPLKPALLAQPEPDILEYSLDLSDTEPGWYSISVRNPSGNETVKERAFEVLPRPLTDEEIAALNALTLDDKEPLPMDAHPGALFFGWGMNIPIGEAAEFYQTDYVGLTLGYSQKFNNDFFRKLYWLKGLGWDFTTTYSNHQTAYPILDVDLQRINFLLGLHYVTPFNFPLNLMVRMSSGIGMSFFTSPEADRDEDIGGFTLSELGSLDYVMRFGVGGRIDVSERWFIDIMCDFSVTLYLSRSAWSVQPKIEGGWRL